MGKVSQKYIEKQIRETFKEITAKLKYLKVLHKLAVINKDLEQAEFDKIVMDHIGPEDFNTLKRLKQ